jgi:hypothetical protein
LPLPKPGLSSSLFASLWEVRKFISYFFNHFRTLWSKLRVCIPDAPTGCRGVA